MKVLQDEIYLRRHYGYEYHVPLPMELSYQAIDTPMDHGPVTAIAIYRYEKSNAIDIHVYKLEGVRVSGFHLTTAKPDRFVTGCDVVSEENYGITGYQEPAKDPTAG